jgi:hypothetical protein
MFRRFGIFYLIKFDPLSILGNEMNAEGVTSWLSLLNKSGSIINPETFRAEIIELWATKERDLINPRASGEIVVKGWGMLEFNFFFLPFDVFDDGSIILSLPSLPLYLITTFLPFPLIYYGSKLQPLEQRT